jgi:Domain of Unknown Function (DUF1080).
MKKIILYVSLLILAPIMVAQESTLNTLTPQEIKKGWTLLFNGQNLEGWTSVGRTTTPERGWTVEDGILTVNKGGAKKGGDIITTQQFSEFDLTFDFRLTKAANSGIKYLFTNYEKGGWLGNEYQVLDDDFHPDAKAGRDGNRKTASLYDVFPAGKKEMKQTGEWNSARIVVKGTKVTHYLNGKVTLSYNSKSKAYKEAVALSKFKEAKPVFGMIEKGYILIQDHQDEVSFRNIKIKDLSK